MFGVCNAMLSFKRHDGHVMAHDCKNTQLLCGESTPHHTLCMRATIILKQRRCDKLMRFTNIDRKLNAASIKKIGLDLLARALFGSVSSCFQANISVIILCFEFFFSGTLLSVNFERSNFVYIYEAVFNSLCF